MHIPQIYAETALYN